MSIKDNPTPITIEMFWNNEPKETHTKECYIGEYDENNPDIDGFYWFDTADGIVCDHGDFTVTKVIVDNDSKNDINPQNLKEGDTFIIVSTDDTDLEEWYKNLDAKDGTIAELEISTIELESQLIWTEDCPYGIQMQDITKIKKPSRGDILEKVYAQMTEDVNVEDFTSIECLLKDVPLESLIAYLPEEG